MTRLHFVGGEKGGVGKSVVARLLAQYCIDHRLPFVGFDTDRSHGALLRFYSDFASAIVADSYESMDRIVETAAEKPDHRLIVDLAAQTQGFLTRWIDDSSLLDLSDDIGVSLTYWHVMDSGRDSADLLVKLLDHFGERLPLVVVLNELRGDDFGIIESSGALARAQELGAKVIALRKLPDSTMQKIDAHSSSFWAATNRESHDGSALGILERARVRTWLARAYDELQRVNP